MNHLLLPGLFAGFVALAAYVFIRYSRKRKYLYKLLRDGLRCENTGDEEGALEIYAVFLEESAKTKFKDHFLLEETARRIKTLRAKQAEQRAFTQKLTYSY